MPFRVLRHLWNQNDTDKTQELLCINKRIRAIFFIGSLSFVSLSWKRFLLERAFKKTQKTISRVGA